MEDVDSNLTRFGCNKDSAMIANGVDTLSQGLINIIFGMLLIPFFIYFCYLCYHILKMRKKSMKFPLMFITFLFLIFIIIRIFIFWDYSFYCSSDALYNVFYSIPLYFLAINIFLFEYIISNGLLDSYSFSFNENEGHQTEAIKDSIDEKIQDVMMLKLPLLIFYICYFIFCYFVMGFHSHKHSIVYESFLVCTIIYTIIYSVFLLFTLIFFEKILIDTKSITTKIHNQILFGKIIILIHCSYRSAFMLANDLIPDILEVKSFTVIIKEYCFNEGCIWIMLIDFLNFIVMELDVYIIFCIFISQFIFEPPNEKKIVSKDNSKLAENLNSSIHNGRVIFKENDLIINESIFSDD